MNMNDQEPLPAVKSSFSKRMLGVDGLLFLGLFLLLLVKGRSEMFQDPGTFWHVAIGRQMLDSGELLHTDCFSFTAAGQPSISQGWLADIGMAWLHRIGGWDLLFVVAAAILAGLFARLGGRLHRAGLPLVRVIILLAMGYISCSYQFHVRPLILTIAFMGATFALLTDVESGRAGIRRLWWLVPLFVLWANVHGGYLGGLGTVALVFSGWCVASSIGMESPVHTWKQRGELTAILGGCAVAMLMNPYGFELPKLWFTILRLPLPDSIEEHKALIDSGFSGWCTLGFAVVYAAILLGVHPRRPRTTWLLPLVWFALAWMRVRNGPLFAVTAIIAIADILPNSYWSRFLSNREELGLKTDRLRLLLPFGALLVAICAAIFHGQSDEVDGGLVKFDRNRWPVELLPELREIGRGQRRTPVFNDESLGGFLIFFTPRLEVFIDDRYELYGDRFLASYLDAIQNNPARIDDWADQYGFKYAVVLSRGRLDEYLQTAPSWTLVKSAPAATLYRRKAWTEEK